MKQTIYLLHKGFHPIIQNKHDTKYFTDKNSLFINIQVPRVIWMFTILSIIVLIPRCIDNDSVGVTDWWDISICRRYLAWTNIILVTTDFSCLSLEEIVSNLTQLVIINYRRKMCRVKFFLISSKVQWYNYI